MKKMLVFLVLLVPVFVFSQVINNFDAASADTNYWNWFDNHGGKHYEVNGGATAEHGWILISHVTDPVQEGAGAMKLEYSVHNTEGWGGYTKLEHWNPDTNAVYDWSRFDSLKFSYYNITPQSLTGRITFRLALQDVSNSTNGNAVYSVNDCEYYYSFEAILDAAPGWHEHKMALLADPGYWSGEGFNRTGWAGIVGNDQLDLDKIKGFSIEFSISGSGDGDYSVGTIVLDNMTLFAPAKTPFVFFNGKSLPSTFSSWAWGQSSIETVEGAGPEEGKNALKWVQGNEWNNGWTGMGFTISPAYDMSFVWATDSVKFKMKAEEGVGALRIQFEASGGKVGLVFNPTADNAWHQYAFKLSDMVYQDGTSGFDPANVGVLGMMAEASGIAGKVIYISDWWTGNPSIDVVPPKAPASLIGIPGPYYNLVAWEDVPGEVDEVYTVYASENPITDLTADGVEIVADNVWGDKQSASHNIYYPLKDKTVRYYYAIICKDAAGNVSPFTASTAVDNVALATATISLNPPANFVADGDFSEWDNSGIMPFVLKESIYVSTGTFDDDDDMTATCYLAVDDNYLYMAFDILDQTYSYDPAGNFWEDDILEVYLGLYNTVKKHTGFKRGAEPDYKFIILSDRFIVDQIGFNSPLFVIADENYEFVDFGASDWGVEVKIPLDSLPTGGATGDARFHPQNGMRITMDIDAHDSDTPNVRDGYLSYSTLSKGNSHEGAQFWSYTWIGDTNKVATAIDEDGNGGAIRNFTLSQNYPNPFNPSTTIEYAIAASANVRVSVFNLLGQEIATLVNEKQQPGQYRVQFQPTDLSSGVYLYRIQAGDFIQTRKMLFVK